MEAPDHIPAAIQAIAHRVIRHSRTWPGRCGTEPSGFLLKASAPGLLVEAVRAALAGNALVSPEVTVRLLQRLGTDRTARQPEPPLTARERDIARLVARGLSNADDRRLFISPGTVKTHVAHLSSKLGGVNRVGVAVWAWKSGLVSRL